jgi:glycosyltransferase involved in cell wall biosynthesis
MRWCRRAVTAERSSSSTAAPRPVEVSVVIPFRNAAPHLRDQLEALAAQEFEREFEVVLADNGSEDESRKIAGDFSDRLNLRVVDASENVGSAFARNEGARSATGQKLVFVDADDVVAPGYVAAMAAGLDRHDFVTSAFDHRILNPDWVQGAHGAGWPNAENPLFVQFGVLPFAGGSIGIARHVFEAVGGFPEYLSRMYDIALSWEVQLAGTDLHFVPEAKYLVRYRTSLRDLFRQGLEGGADAALLYRHYRRLGMTRRTASEAIKSWLRLILRFSRARSKADLAPLAVQFGRQIGRPLGSLRHRVYFP